MESGIQKKWVDAVKSIYTYLWFINYVTHKNIYAPSPLERNQRETWKHKKMEMENRRFEKIKTFSFQKASLTSLLYFITDQGRAFYKIQARV